MKQFHYCPAESRYPKALGNEVSKRNSLHGRYKTTDKLNDHHTELVELPRFAIETITRCGLMHLGGDV